MPIAFRSSLRNLVEHYQAIGGLRQFTLDYRNSAVSSAARPLVSEALARISNTIVKGPVAYAGGALETGRVFSYDSHRHLITMSTPLWHDLSLLGHWVQQAILLRWAELTSEMSRYQVRTSDVVELLLTTPLPERDVADAREIYQQSPGRECVWTARPIPKAFAVDHVIPFSLWHNNDLWNLMPVTPSVNAAKSDRLPTHDLVVRRRECLIHYWQILRDAYPVRFEFETTRLAGISGSSRDWQDWLFHSVSESLEVTAIQRGCERWEP